MSYIKKCHLCQINKYTIYIKYEQSQIIKTPEQSWHTITIDFVVKLLKSKNSVIGIEYNVI